MKIRQIGKSNLNNTSYILFNCQKKLDKSIENDKYEWITLTKIL